MIALPIGIHGKVMLPQQVVARLGASRSRLLLLVETVDGGYELRPAGEEFRRQWEYGDEALRRFGNALAEAERR